MVQMPILAHAFVFAFSLPSIVNVIFSVLAPILELKCT